ncbi:hypothetical protein ARSEF4850_002015 [Beauveria asiatica]
MSTPSFRSLVCSRARPELLKTGHALGNYFREFSTTQSLADNATAPPSGRGNDDSNGRGQGNARERGRAAVSAINSMMRGRGRSVAAPRPDGGAPTAGAGGPKVLDVRSLPRGLTRGRGGFRGSGGGSSTGPAGVNRFAAQGRGGGSGGGRGGFRGRGGAASSRGRGNRGGRGGRRGGRAEDGEKRDSGGRRKGGAPEADPYAVMDEAETAFDTAIRFRQRTPYDPALDVDGLLAHAPAVPTSVAGRRAAILGSLQAMGGGTGDSIGAPNGYLPSAVDGRVQQDGLAFFATPAARGWAEEQIQAKQREGGADAATTTTTTTTAFATVGEAVQKVVFEAAVVGAHETPRFATDVHGIVRAQHLRAGSYGPAATAMFEKKLRSLVGEPKPAAVEADRAEEAKA